MWRNARKGIETRQSDSLSLSHALSPTQASVAARWLSQHHGLLNPTLKVQARLPAMGDLFPCPFPR
jgi:hypothetical protein